MHYILFFGFAFSMILSLSQIVRKKPELANFLNSGIFLCNGILQLGIFLIALRIPVKYPLAIFAFISTIFIIGPLLLFYSFILFNSSASHTGLPKRLKVHLLPGMCVLSAEIIFQLQPAGYKKSIIDQTLNGPEWSGITLLCFAGAVHATLYLLYVLYKGLSVWDIESVRVPLRIMFFVFFASLAAVLVVAWGFFAQNQDVFLTGGAMIPATNAVVFLSTHRYPQFFRVLESEIKKKKYERSLLYGIDTELLSDRLNDLMTDKCLYKDFDITLEKLSGMLLIRPHQLSQMLNERLGMNFWQYINSFRVEEAKILLVNNPEQSIISICFNVGFGSKSTFNDIFRKFTGENPREYRTRHAK